MDEPVEVLDCTGMRCPLPVIELARVAGGIRPGAVVRLLATDPAARVDVPAWCRLRGEELVAMSLADGVTTFDVRHLPRDPLPRDPLPRDPLPRDPTV